MQSSALEDVEQFFSKWATYHLKQYYGLVIEFIILKVFHNNVMQLASHGLSVAFHDIQYHMYKVKTKKIQ